MRKPIIDAGFTFAPIDLAAKFSIDCNFNLPFKNTFGFHRIQALNRVLIEERIDV
jgi:hypothetical protein